MPLANQITQVAFASNSFSGGNGSTSTYTDPAGGSYAATEVYEIDIQNMDISTTPVYYTGNAYDAALSGKLRSNLRGYRISFRLSFERSLQRTFVRKLFTYLQDAFADNNDDSVSFFPDTDDKTNSIEVVIDDLEYLYQYNNTVGSLSPTINVTSLDIQSAIPDYLV